MTTQAAQLWQLEMTALQAAFEDRHPFGYGTVEITGGQSCLDEDEATVLHVMIASTIEQKARGMVGQGWGVWDGLAFTEPVETTAEFHMQGVTVPMVLALFDGDGLFVERFVMSPGDPKVSPTRPFRTALELPWPAAGEVELAGTRLTLEARDFSADERKKLASEGKAMSDGSFPIVTVADLKNAISAYGRASDKAAAKAHIIKRAMAAMTSICSNGPRRGVVAWRWARLRMTYVR